MTYLLTIQAQTEKPKHQKILLTQSILLLL